MSDSTHLPNVDPFILEALRRGKCVIITGPDLLRQVGAQQPLRQAFHEVQVAKGLEQQAFLRYYEQEDLYLFENSAQQTRFYFALQPFFSQQVEVKPYRQLSELPVGLFLNGSPDLVLRDLLAQDGAFYFFHKGNPRQNLPEFSPQRPLVYNLLGSIEEEESLILTHDDLFQYLERIFAEGQVPQPILDALFEARCLIFLGVGFDKWYVQLLLRLLRVNDERYARYAAPMPAHPHTLSICTDQFQIQFVNDEIEAFVQVLHDQCRVEGLLLSRGHDRGPSKEKPWLEKVKALITEDELEEALDEIDLRLNHLQEASNEVSTYLGTSILLRGQLTRLSRRKMKNVISFAEYELQRNDLADRILQLAQKIDQDHG